MESNSDNSIKANGPKQVVTTATQPSVANVPSITASAVKAQPGVPTVGPLSRPISASVPRAVVNPSVMPKGMPILPGAKLITTKPIAIAKAGAPIVPTASVSVPGLPMKVSLPSAVIPGVPRVSSATSATSTSVGSSAPSAAVGSGSQSGAMGTPKSTTPIAGVRPIVGTSTGSALPRPVVPVILKGKVGGLQAAGSTLLPGFGATPTLGVPGVVSVSHVSNSQMPLTTGINSMMWYRPVNSEKVDSSVNISSENEFTEPLDEYKLPSLPTSDAVRGGLPGVGAIMGGRPWPANVLSNTTRVSTVATAALTATSNASSGSADLKQSFEFESTHGVLSAAVDISSGNGSSYDSALFTYSTTSLEDATTTLESRSSSISLNGSIYPPSNPSAASYPMFPPKGLKTMNATQPFEKEIPTLTLNPVTFSLFAPPTLAGYMHDNGPTAVTGSRLGMLSGTAVKVSYDSLNSSETSKSNVAVYTPSAGFTEAAFVTAQTSSLATLTALPAIAASLSDDTSKEPVYPTSSSYSGSGELPLSSPISNLLTTNTQAVPPEGLQGLPRASGAFLTQHIVPLAKEKIAPTMQPPLSSASYLAGFNGTLPYHEVLMNLSTVAGSAPALPVDHAPRAPLVPPNSAIGAAIATGTSPSTFLGTGNFSAGRLVHGTQVKAKDASHILAHEDKDIPGLLLNEQGKLLFSAPGINGPASAEEVVLGAWGEIVSVQSSALSSSMNSGSDDTSVIKMPPDSNRMSQSLVTTSSNSSTIAANVKKGSSGGLLSAAALTGVVASIVNNYRAVKSKNADFVNLSVGDKAALMAKFLDLGRSGQGAPLPLPSYLQRLESHLLHLEGDDTEANIEPSSTLDVLSDSLKDKEKEKNSALSASGHAVFSTSGGLNVPSLGASYSVTSKALEAVDSDRLVNLLSRGVRDPLATMATANAPQSSAGPVTAADTVATFASAPLSVAAFKQRLTGALVTNPLVSSSGVISIDPPCTAPPVVPEGPQYDRDITAPKVPSVYSDLRFSPFVPANADYKQLTNYVLGASAPDLTLNPGLPVPPSIMQSISNSNSSSSNTNSGDGEPAKGSTDSFAKACIPGPNTIAAAALAQQQGLSAPFDPLSGTETVVFMPPDGVGIALAPPIDTASWHNRGASTVSALPPFDYFLDPCLTTGWFLPTVNGFLDTSSSKSESMDRKADISPEILFELKLWFARHWAHPYPSASVVQSLLRQTGLPAHILRAWLAHERSVHNRVAISPNFQTPVCRLHAPGVSVLPSLLRDALDEQLSALATTVVISKESKRWDFSEAITTADSVSQAESISVDDAGRPVVNRGALPPTVVDDPDVGATLLGLDIGALKLPVNTSVSKTDEENPVSETVPASNPSTPTKSVVNILEYPHLRSDPRIPQIPGIPVLTDLIKIPKHAHVVCLLPSAFIAANGLSIPGYSPPSGQAVADGIENKLLFQGKPLSQTVSPVSAQYLSSSPLLLEVQVTESASTAEAPAKSGKHIWFVPLGTAFEPKSVAAARARASTRRRQCRICSARPDPDPESNHGNPFDVNPESFNDNSCTSDAPLASHLDLLQMYGLRKRELALKAKRSRIAAAMKEEEEWALVATSMNLQIPTNSSVLSRGDLSPSGEDVDIKRKLIEAMGSSSSSSNSAVGDKNYPHDDSTMEWN